MNALNQDRLQKSQETFNTIVLAIATLAVAWCSYQSSLWSGIQTFNLADFNQYSRLAQQKLIESGQRTAMDEAVMIDFIDAVFDQENDKIDYILKEVRPEMASVLSHWLEAHRSARSHNPVAQDDYKSLMGERTEESRKMNSNSEAAFQRAERANTNGDRYSLLGVMLSTAMFLAAISTKLKRVTMQLSLTTIAGVICIGALLLMFFVMPVAHQGS